MIRLYKRYSDLILLLPRSRSAKYIRSSENGWCETNGTWLRLLLVVGCLLTQLPVRISAAEDTAMQPPGINAFTDVAKKHSNDMLQTSANDPDDAIDHDDDEFFDDEDDDDDIDYKGLGANKSSMLLIFHQHCIVTVLNRFNLNNNILSSGIGLYIGAFCNVTCSTKLHHAMCDLATNTCVCEKKYPVVIGLKRGCAKRKRLCFIFSYICFRGQIVPGSLQLTISIKPKCICISVIFLFECIRYRPDFNHVRMIQLRKLASNAFMTKRVCSTI